MTVDQFANDAAADADIEPVGEAPEPLRGKRKRDKGLLIASFVIACGLALIVWGMFTALTGTEGVDRPDEIESVSPVENAIQVLQQDRVVVDLVFGYEAELIVDGVVLETTSIGEVEVEPGQQVTVPDVPTAIFDPGNAVISFQPSEDAVITEFSQGRHVVRVEYWPTDEPNNRQSYTWSFVVV